MMGLVFFLKQKLSLQHVFLPLKIGCAVLPWKPQAGFILIYIHRRRRWGPSPNSPVLLSYEPLCLCWSKISISDISISGLCDPHWLQNRLCSEKGLSLAVMQEGHFRKWRRQMGKLFIHVKLISHCTKPRSEVCFLSLAFHSPPASTACWDPWVFIILCIGQKSPLVSFFTNALLGSSLLYLPPCLEEKGGECDLQTNTSRSSFVLLSSL